MKVRYAPPETRYWAFMSWSDVPSKLDPKLVYLRRLRIFQTPWFGVYLHWINEPDTDRHPHDHPWNFWSLILRGGYTEDVYTTRYAVLTGPGELSERNMWRRWSWHQMPVAKAHSITFVEPGLMTLVITGKRVRTWCFWTEDGLIPWRDYLAANEGHDEGGEVIWYFDLAEWRHRSIQTRS